MTFSGDWGSALRRRFTDAFRPTANHATLARGRRTSKRGELMSYRVAAGAIAGAVLLGLTCGPGMAAETWDMPLA